MYIIPLIYLFLSSQINENDLIITARLDTITVTPHCGTFYWGATAKYTDITILQGQYDYLSIFVIHGCPELARSADDGTLQKFKIGEYHRLVLTKENVHKIENIVSFDSSQLSITDSLTFFSRRVDLFK